MKKLYVAAFLLTLIGFACTKDLEAPHNIPINAQNITGGYLLIGFTSKTQAYPEVDLLNTLDVCRQDDQYLFKKDGSFAVVDAGVQCADAINRSGQWQLLNNTTLRMQESDYTVLNFQGKVLTVSKTVVQNGDPVLITKRFMRL